jgi:hypothetical protein
MTQGPPGYPPPPPPPPGPAPVAADPYAAERALGEWATARGLSLSQTPDLAWYQAWAPFIYLFRIGRVGRDLRGKLDDADLAIVEAFDADPIKQAAADSVCCLMSPCGHAPRCAPRAAEGSSAT